MSKWLPADQRQRSAKLGVRGLILYLVGCETEAWRVIDYQRHGSGPRYTLTVTHLISGEQSRCASTDVDLMLAAGKMATRCDRVLS